MNARSFIITDKMTGKAVFETFNPKIAAAINKAKYNVETAHAYLCRLNASIQAKGGQP